MESKNRLYFIISWIAILLIIGTVFYHNLEGWSYFNSFYFSTTTIATVGFGDLHPVTFQGKLFTIIFVLIGVASALYAFTVLGEIYFEHHTVRVNQTVDRIRQIKNFNSRGKIKEKIRNHKDQLVEGNELLKK